MKHCIDGIKAIEILDSRGMPTIGCWVSAGDFKVFASVPSGSSCGQFEAHELRDNDTKRYYGKGVTKSIGYIHDLIAPALLGFPLEPRKVDWLLRSLDKDPLYSNIGANTILVVSMAIHKLFAATQTSSLYDVIDSPKKLVLPTPMFNIINGGSHANNNIDLQEFMIVPTGFESFHESLRCGSEIFHMLKRCLDERGFSTSVGDEGGFSPNFESVDEVFSIMMEAVTRAGYQLSRHVSFAIDFASSEFYENGYYCLKSTGQKYSTKQWIDQIVDWVNRFPIVSLEDPLADTDIDGWIELNKKLGNQILLVGDDLLVTQTERLKKAIEQGWSNAILIKPNQVGSISQTLETIDLAQTHQFECVMSHRSGETEDTFISDLAVGSGVRYIKAGSLNRSERLAKYNRLLQIEHELDHV